MRKGKIIGKEAPNGIPIHHLGFHQIPHLIAKINFIKLIRPIQRIFRTGRTEEKVVTNTSALINNNPGLRTYSAVPLRFTLLIHTHLSGSSST